MNYIDTDNVNEFCEGGFTSPKEVKQEISDDRFYKFDQLHPFMFCKYHIVLQEHFEKRTRTKKEKEK